MCCALALDRHRARCIDRDCAPRIRRCSSVRRCSSPPTAPSCRRAIATGAGHTCVLYSDQSIRCTGQNSQGQVGNGTYTNVFEPALATGTVNPVTLRTGLEHTCTLVGDGRMQCWGTNYTGQLGDGTMGGFAMTPQFVHGMTNAVKAITGGFFTCAIFHRQHGAVLGTQSGRTARQRRQHDRRAAAGAGSGSRARRRFRRRAAITPAPSWAIAP